jgi:hypothetical protein
MLRSASVMSNHGPTISRTANANTAGHTRRVGLIMPRLMAMGIRISAPKKTLRKTMLGVWKCSIAIAIKK